MRYIETEKGVVMGAPTALVSHMDLVRAAQGVSKENVKSAGFVTHTNSASEEWRTFGESVALAIAADKNLKISKELWCVLMGDRFKTVVYSTNPELIRHLGDVVSANWGMTKEGAWGECPIYAPMHPNRMFSTEDITNK